MGEKKRNEEKEKGKGGRRFRKKKYAWVRQKWKNVSEFDVLRKKEIIGFMRASI